MKVLIEGWTRYPHSYVLVNINQILALDRTGEVDIYMKEVPPFREAWQREDLREIALFTDAEITRLEEIENKSTHNISFDVVYRISYPYVTEQPVNPDGTYPKLFVFYTAEFAELHERDFADCDVKTFIDKCFRKEIIPVTPSNWSANPLNAKQAPPVVIPHGIDPTKLYVDSEARENFRRLLGIPKDAFVFLHLGSMTGNKNVKAIILAFYRLSSLHDNVHLLLKGLGRLYNSKANVNAAIDDLIREGSISAKRWKKLSKRCMFLDQVLNFDEMRALYNVCDSYVSPFVGEGFGIPILEAVACGRPVIVSKGGSSDDFTNDDIALYPVTASWDSNHTLEYTDHYLVVKQWSLEEQMTKVMTDAEWRKTVTTKGPQWCKNFTWNEIASKLVSCMRYFVTTSYRHGGQPIFDCRSASRAAM